MMYDPYRQLWSAVINATLEDIWYEKPRVCDACVAVANDNWATICTRAGAPHAEVGHRRVMQQRLPGIVMRHYHKAQAALWDWQENHTDDVTRLQRVTGLFVEARRMNSLITK